MTDYLFLIPIALGIGVTALSAFMWSLKNGQYDDLEGAAERILHEENDAPLRTSTARAVKPVAKQIKNKSEGIHQKCC
jgi:cbb3-type cytochrome oxidase maturation protein